MRGLQYLLILCCCGLAVSAQAARLALVIGNNAYQGKEYYLDGKPLNDGQDVTQLLKGVGFKVSSFYDLDHENFDYRIQQFSNKIREGDEVVVYYSGHGAQHQGENYLIPVGAINRVNTFASLKYKAVNVDYLLETLVSNKPNISIVMLDACRNNPFKGLVKTKGGKAAEGFASQSTPSGVLLAYATEENRAALAGAGRNSPYVEALKQELPRKQSIFDMFTNVRNRVSESTGGFQNPSFYSKLNAGFCFGGCGKDVILPVGHVFQDRLKDGGLAPKMVVMPTGSFRMGDIQGRGGSNEKPVHKVTINYPFAMGQYEVTFDEYDRFTQATGREKASDKESWGRRQRPVINVSWNDAKAYTKWLSQQTGYQYRLPSEAEWEYAARAGTETKYAFGNDKNQLGQYAWYRDNSDKKTHPVGQKRPNQWGLYDMHGNVWEWVEDSWHDNYKGAPTDGSAWIKNGVQYKALRGGSWYYNSSLCRAAERRLNLTDSRYGSSGFRVVRVVSPRM